MLEQVSKITQEINADALRVASIVTAKSKEDLRDTWLGPESIADQVQVLAVGGELYDSCSIRDQTSHQSEHILVGGVSVGEHCQDSKQEVLCSKLADQCMEESQTAMGGDVLESCSETEQ